MYMDNMKRTENLNGEKKLELIQDHYTEPRLFKIQGDGGHWNEIGINSRAATGDIINNVNVGRYSLAITSTPLSATYMASQFEELMDLIHQGVIPMPMAQDIAIDLSTVPQKELIKRRVDAFLQAQGFITADQLLQLQAQGIQVDPSKLPPSPEPGKPGQRKQEGNPSKEGDTMGSAAASVLPPSPAPVAAPAAAAAPGA